MDSKEIEHTLSELDDKVGRLRALYEQYFMGIEKLEPQTPRKDVDRVIAQLRKIQLRNTAQRFRFQTIIQRYNTMQQHWSRTLREMEAGTFRRDVLRAAERFGVDDAVTAVGKRRAAKMTSALEAKRAQEKERENVRRKQLEPGHDEFESVSDADLVEDDDDDDAPTPPPMRPRPPPAQVWELHDPGDELTYVPPGAEPIPAAAATNARPLGINPFGGRARPPSISQLTQAAESNDGPPGLGATASYPSAVQLNLTEGVEKAEKKTAGGLRLGGGPRRASAEALSRIASALGGDAATAQAPPVAALPPSAPGVTAVPPARSSTSGIHAGFRGSQANPAVSSPPLGPNFSSGPVLERAGDASGARKPLLSQPLDIDLSGMGAPPQPAPARTWAQEQPVAAPQARKPLLSQPLDIDVVGPTPAPDSSRTVTGALRPPPAANRPSAPRTFETATPRDAAPPRAPAPAASRPEPAPPKDLSDQRMREIYSQYVQTRRERNEPTTNITFEKLSESLRSQTEKLKQKHATKKIDYEIVVKDGKTLIKPIVR